MPIITPVGGGNGGGSSGLQHVYDGAVKTTVDPKSDDNPSPVPLIWSDEYPTDDDIVDLTDPLAPVVRAAGIYAVTVMFCFLPAAGKSAYCSIDLFNDSPDTTMYATSVMNLDVIVTANGTIFPQIAMHVTGRMPAGALISVRVMHNADAPLDVFPECMVCKIG